jgi:uncharacterized protein
MRRKTVEAVVRWQDALDDSNEPLEITFHGGEPLVPGTEFYRTALPLLRDGLAHRKVRLGIQSNLWLLTNELGELFREYGVSIGTSLDGPENINDAARAHSIDVGCICTFTAQSAGQADEVFDFFVRERLSFSIHAALPTLGHSGDGWVLSPEAYGQLLTGMLDRYLANVDKVRISTLDAMCRSVSAGHGGICTFGDCLGKYLAVDPEGWIYSCQRFAGMARYRLGNVHDYPSLETLATSLFWRKLKARQRRITEECGNCEYLRFCRGGCPYNALVVNGGHFSFSQVVCDPYCSAYRCIFNYITERAIEEVFSEENLRAVANHPNPEAGLLRRGDLISIIRKTLI